MVIIGIDPGSRFTGYGIIEYHHQQKSIYLTSGRLSINARDPGARLQQIFHGLTAIIEAFKPQEAAIEQVFMHQNPNSALKLGQARGAAMVACNIPIAEYSARQVKQSVVGYGAAKKEQVQHMVLRILNIQEDLAPDAADALAIALCHAHSRFVISLVGNRPSARRKRSSWRDYQPPG